MSEVNMFYDNHQALPVLTAEIFFWAAVLLILYAYAGYPLLLSVLAPLFPKQRKQIGYTPLATIIIAAHDEAKNIREKLEQTLALEYPSGKLEILVVSDASSDGTDEIVESFRDSRIRLIRIPRRLGKTNAQNVAAEQSKGEILVFSDATSTYHPKSLLYLACNYDDPKIGAVSGRYKYFDRDGVSPTGLGSIAFWNYENLIKTMQSRIYTLTGCSGCIYSVRRSLYQPLPNEACSDLVEPLCIVRKGYRIVFEDRALAHEETTKSATEEFGMRVRVAARGMRGLISARDLLNIRSHGWIAFQLVSHKILRWMVPLYLIAILFVSALLAPAIPFFRVLLWLQAIFYLLGALTAFVPLPRKLKLLAIPLYFCTMNGAVLFGLLRILQGNKFSVWQTVRK